MKLKHAKEKVDLQKKPYEALLKYVDTGDSVPVGANLIKKKDGKKTLKFVLRDGQEVLVDSSHNLNRARLQYVDTREDVPVGAHIIERKDGKKTLKFVLRDGQDVRVDSYSNLHQARLQYVDTREYVPVGAHVIERKDGEKTLRFVLRDGQEVLVDSPHTLNQARLQYVDTREDVPVGAHVIERKDGKKTLKFVLRDGQEIRVDSSRNLSLARLQYVDTREDVPVGAHIIERKDGKKTLKFVLRDGQEVRVDSYSNLKQTRLQYVDTREDVPVGAAIIERKDGKKTLKFVLRDGQEVRVDTYDNLNRTRLQYVDTREYVPVGALIIERKDGEKTLKFVLRDGQEVLVDTYDNLNQARLQYVDTREYVPVDAHIIEKKDGKKTLKFVLRDGQEVRVDSPHNLHQTRLQYVDTREDVPIGTPIIKRKDGKKTLKFVLRDAQEVRVDSYSNLHQTRLQYVDTREDVPIGAAIIERKDGKKTLKFVLRDGQEVRVDTYDNLNRTRLQYVDTREYVPVGAHVIERKDGKKTLKFVLRDGQEVRVDTYDNLCRTRSQRANDTPRDKVDEVFSSQKITGGISYKDLSLPAIPDLPSALSMQPTLLLKWKKLDFKTLREWPSSSSSALPEPIIWESDDYKLALYSDSNFTQENQLCFIFAGGKLKAFLPDIKEADSNFRQILVIPDNELSVFHPYIQKGISLLCIKELKSKTHGYYEKLGLINSRRIAAFIAAKRFNKEYGIDHALMCDDNLTHLYHQKDHGYTWSDWFQDMVGELGAKACVSLATPSSKQTKLSDIYTLGSKLFLFNLKLISQTLPPNSSGFDLFYPAHANDFWGGDYLFQLMLHELGATHDSPYNGFGIIDPRRMMIGCTDKHRGARKQVLKKAHEINLSFEHLFPEGVASSLSLVTVEKIPKSLSRLNEIIQENIATHKELMARRAAEDILKLHAEAHQLGPIPEPRLRVASDTSPEDFLSEFFIELRKLISLDSCLLRPYQRSIIEEIITQGGEGKLKGIIDMATGTGKTHVEIILALAAQRTRLNGAIVMVTPYIQLARQMLEQYLEVLKQLGMQEYLPYVIQVDSESDNITRSLLELNHTLSAYPCVYLCCAASYDRLLQSENLHNNPLLDALKKPNVLILDESHLCPEITIKRIKKVLTSSPNTFIASLTATVKRKDFKDFNITYPRELAVEQGYLAPSILDRFNLDYSEEAVLDVIHCMENILEWKSPNGKALREEKCIIYVPDNFEGTNYSEILHQHLSSKGILSLEINSDSKGKQLAEKIKAFTSSGSLDAPRIAICKNMLKVGFSYDEVCCIIDLRNSAAHAFAQAAGRAMRLWKEHPNKIAYFLSWKNVKFQSV